MVKISLGCDHAGYSTKEEIKKLLTSKGFVIEDKGCYSEDSVDYPKFAHNVAEDVLNGNSEKGILVCGSGNGVSMTANKHQGIRAALCWNKEIAELSRLHNNANVICLPARYASLEEILEMVDVFINTQFEGGRHERRVKGIACS